MLTRVLKDKVNLHRVVLVVDTVLTRSVEVELSQLVGTVLGGQGTVGQDNLKAKSKVLKLDIVGAGNTELDSLDAGVINFVSDNIDGRLVLALGASTVLGHV